MVEKRRIPAAAIVEEEEEEEMDMTLEAVIKALEGAGTMEDGMEDSLIHHLTKEEVEEEVMTLQGEMDQMTQTILIKDLEDRAMSMQLSDKYDLSDPNQFILTQN
ncbi:hypothetical protein FRC06_008414 [Ceratobasidium sp. 370]|nr:hypothetical protein FRC06_008414 [Ceratobasidium sp. 370]